MWISFLKIGLIYFFKKLNLKVRVTKLEKEGLLLDFFLDDHI